MSHPGKGQTNADVGTGTKARRAAPFGVISAILRLVLTLISMLLLVRYLEPATFGFWILLSGLIAPLSAVTSLGFRHSLIRFLPALDDAVDRSAFFWTVAIRRTLAATVVAIVGYLTLPLYADRFGLAGYEGTLLTILPGVVFATGAAYLVTGLDSIFRQREVLLITGTAQIINVVGVITGILLVQPLVYFTSLFSIVWAATFAHGVVRGYQFFGAPSLRCFTHARGESREERRYRRVSFVDELGERFLSTEITRYFIAAVSSSVELAIFGVASTVVERLRQMLPLELFRPLATVSFFRRHEEAQDIDEINRMFHFLMATNRLATFGYLSLFVPIGREALALVFRPEYASAYLPALFLFIGIAIFGMPIGIVAQGLKRPEALLYAKSAVFVNVGLGLPLSMEYGAAGLAFSTMIAMAVKNWLTYLLLRLHDQIRYPWIPTLCYMVVFVITASSVYLLNQYLPVLVSGALGAVIYLIATRVLGVLNTDQRRLIVSLVPDRFKSAGIAIFGD